MAKAGPPLQSFSNSTTITPVAVSAQARNPHTPGAAEIRQVVTGHSSSVEDGAF